MEMVLQILRGSQRINEMKEIINYFINMLCGLVEKQSLKDYKYEKVIFVFFHHDMPWRITKAKDSLSVSYGPLDVHGRFLQYSHGQEINRRHVQAIYEGLPVFLEKMLEAFPELKDKLAPFLAAASINREKSQPASFIRAGVTLNYESDPQAEGYLFLEDEEGKPQLWPNTFAHKWSADFIRIVPEDIRDLAEILASTHNLAVAQITDTSYTFVTRKNN